MLFANVLERSMFHRKDVMAIGMTNDPAKRAMAGMGSLRSEAGASALDHDARKPGKRPHRPRLAGFSEDWRDFLIGLGRGQDVARSSLSSQARAVCQSRSAVAVEIPSASAASSSDRPPKNRSSAS